MARNKVQIVDTNSSRSRMLNKLTYINAGLNKLRNYDVMGGAKCTARTARLRTPLLYTTSIPLIPIEEKEPEIKEE